METATTQAVVAPQKDAVPFNSHCARESLETRLSESGPSRLTVKELKAQLTVRDVTFLSNAKKATLVELLLSETKPAIVTPQKDAESDPSKLTVKELKTRLTERDVKFLSNAKKATLVELLISSETETKEEPRDSKTVLFVSSETAAAEKAAAGENMAVEHIAELAPGQARRARARVSKNTNTNEKLAKMNIVSSDIMIDASRDTKTISPRKPKRARKN